MAALAGWEVERLVLTTEPGRRLLDEVGRIQDPGPSDLTRWRSMAPEGWVAAALRIGATRQRARSKFSRADAMWLDPVALEQATAEVVATHKAARFLGAEIVVDLCCGIGGDALALASRAGIVLAVDRDAAMTRRVQWNGRVHGVEARLRPIRADAERFPIPGGAWVHVDPDRRARTGARARSVAAYAPGMGFLTRLIREVQGGAIKLGPASDFEAHFASPGTEIEVISLGGECKEATVWFGSRATCRRRATVLPAGAIWTDADGPKSVSLGYREVGSFVFEPDPALIRAGLLDGFAAAHGLDALGPGVGWLTGDHAGRSPFLTSFAVEAVTPFDRKRLRRLLADRGVGSVEIKTRGLALDPAELRRGLRCEGDRAATLMIYGGRGPSRAVLAHREETSPPGSDGAGGECPS